MDPRTPVRYWSAEELTAALERARFGVRRHLMVDVLPYPHVLYICKLTEHGEAKIARLDPRAAGRH